MATSIISIAGIRADGRHGANPGEKLEPQPFVVDLEVAVELGEEDSLEATVDYRALIDATRRTVQETSFDLLESLAGAVAREVFSFDPVRRVTATVHKPAAAEGLGVDDVSADASEP